MRSLDPQALGDISRGSAVLGSGGGGDPYLGTLAALRSCEAYGQPTLIDASELADDALVASCAVFGAPMPFIEKLTSGAELYNAYERLVERLGRPLDALVPIEAGGVNMLIPFIMAARVGLPVVDGDWIGRAFPSLNLQMTTLYGLSVCPVVIADEHGNSVCVEAIDNDWADRLCRAAAVEFGATAASASTSVTGAQLKEAAILGSVTRAQEIGEAVRKAAEHKEDPVARLLSETGGYELFRGKIVDVQRTTADSTTFGSVIVQGFNEQAETRLTVHFRNENLVAQLETGEVLAVTPDVITLIDSDTGQAITTDRLRYGFRVIVLGMAVDEKWRTPAGVELGGPRAFGYDVDYAPIEQLAPQRGTETASA